MPTSSAHLEYQGFCPFSVRDYEAGKKNGLVVYMVCVRTSADLIGAIIGFVGKGLFGEGKGEGGVSLRPTIAPALIAYRRLLSFPGMQPALAA